MSSIDRLAPTPNSAARPPTRADSSTNIPVAVSQPKNAEPNFMPPKCSFSRWCSSLRSDTLGTPDPAAAPRGEGRSRPASAASRSRSGTTGTTRVWACVVASPAGRDSLDAEIGGACRRVGLSPVSPEPPEYMPGT